MIRPAVESALFRWARERAGIPEQRLRRRFPNLEAWEEGAERPTLKQLESFAKATHAPIGYFFLPTPPVETLPVPDFRSGREARGRKPSANLLDTVYLCQQRQEWYRDFARIEGEKPRPFVGSATLKTPVVEAARKIGDIIGFDLESREAAKTWDQALRQFVEQVDAAGILVMRNGVVHNNTHRKLGVAEFRGFALTDPLAPLVFLNSADSRSAQMFTLAHELGHIWLGRSGLDDVQMRSLPSDSTEGWCNAVAAELLVPMDAFRLALNAELNLESDLRRLARQFKVSTLMILRRLFDAAELSRRAFHEAFERELRRIPERKASGGGDFYLTETARVGRRFASALIGSALEGQTLFPDAYRMLGINKTSTFNELGRHLGLTD